MSEHTGDANGNLETLNIYAEGEKVYVKEFEDGRGPLYVKTASKTNVQSETGAQKWVYTLAKGDAPEAEGLDGTFAEKDLRNDPFEQAYAQLLHA